MSDQIILHSFDVVYPRYKEGQEEILSWLFRAHEEYGAKVPEHLRRYCVSKEQVAQRYFECPDLNYDWETHKIYRKPPHVADISERTLFFSQRALEIFSEFYQEGGETPHHLVHVTCTGYISPSPPQRFFSGHERVPCITHAYHMGCYASLPSIRLGKALAAKAGKRVDIVHTEMCSLHFNPGEPTPEQLVCQSLFADGHIKYSLDNNFSGPGLRILCIDEKLLPNSLEDMTWIPSSHGMKMTLSKDVPGKIKDHALSFYLKLCLAAGLDPLATTQEAIFAIHPGGPKIIESIEKGFELREEQVKYSKKVLKERGNMSSATLPHVWKEILEDRPEQGRLVVSLAFGPGLTIFGSIFEVQG